MNKPITIHYQDGYVITPDDFNEPPNVEWGLVFSEPVELQDVLRAVCVAGLPLVQFRTTYCTEKETVE